MVAGVVHACRTEADKWGGRVGTTMDCRPPPQQFNFRLHCPHYL